VCVSGCNGALWWVWWGGGGGGGGGGGLGTFEGFVIGVGKKISGHPLVLAGNFP